jgi:hypothetical protein
LRLARNPEVVATEVESGAVLLNLETRLYYSLNETAVEVWRYVESAPDAESLGGQIASLFEVDEAVAADSVLRLVDELVRARLLVETDDEPDSAAVARLNGTADRRRRFTPPELVQHDEPLHEVTTSAFDPQLPLAE